MTPRPNRAQQNQLRVFLKNFSRSQNGAMLISISLGIVNALLMIVSCYLLAHICHAVMFADEHLAQQHTQLAILAAIVVLRALCSGVSRYVSERCAIALKQQMRHALWQAMVTKQRQGQLEHNPAQLVNTLNQGVESLHDYFAKYIPAVAYAGFIPLAIIAVVFPIDWQSGLIFLVTAPLIPFFMILIGYKAEALNEQNWQQLQRLGHYFMDRLQGLVQLKLFNNERQQIENVALMADKFRITTLSVLRIAFISTLALEFLATISIALVAVIIGFRLYFGSLDFATGFVVLLLAPEFYLPLRQLGQHYHAKLKGLASASSMLSLLQKADTDTIKGEQLADHTPIHTVSTENLCWRFDDAQHDTLQQLSLKFCGPGMHAIVGASGSGKSTLLDCLMGLKPSVAEAIKINDHALSTLDIQQYQQRIAWVAQSPTLFSGSIAENVALAQPEAPLSAIRAVCKDVALDDYIMTLAQGYDTPIGELGRGLSGGQIQRLALARALLGKPDVLFLDEPTAALDKHSEAHVQRCLEQLSKHCLIIVIAHRLHTISDAQQVVVMEHGRITEQGNYSQLIQQPHSALNHLLQGAAIDHG